MSCRTPTVKLLGVEQGWIKGGKNYDDFSARFVNIDFDDQLKKADFVSQL